MREKQEYIRSLQKCLETNKSLTDEDKKAIEAAITAIRQEEWMDVLIKLLPALGSMAAGLLQHHK